MNTVERIEHHEVVILGAGFGGLGMAARMKIAGIDDFVVIEKRPDLGGVWLDNSYPGAACDTESHLYCYSFHPHLRVSAMYAGRNELLNYLKSLATRFGLAEHLRFNREIRSAEWDVVARLWRFELNDGSRLTARFFVPAWGQLNRPMIPAVRGLESFKGDYFHSAEWRHDVDLSAKRVASIGNAASAVQYVPAIAPKVAQLTVFQRSANWIMPRNQIIFPKEQLDLYEEEPHLFEESRKSLHAFRESGFERTRIGSNAQMEGKSLALAHLHRQVSDPVLREKLTPDYEYACKRILRSDDYYPALMRDNVSLETAGVEAFVEDGIETRDGRILPFDVVVFGTGFESQAFQGSLQVRGTNGTLAQAWEHGPEAYLGITVPGFPNMFMLYGPNTNLNHNSIVSMLEIQQNYIIDAIGSMAAAGVDAVDVDRAVFDEYNSKLQAAMAGSAFSAGCSSWYKNAQGRVINNWPGTVDEYRAVTRWDQSVFGTR
ncbi:MULTISPECIES: flavin-containing monooxygenase [Burkholderia cepacia complex]|uniref:flavin-containing monooxygenase n=1 Tax=Burkholderia cepacia complex TaxID=87882 RepID=UPI000981F0E8|nr:MULTISPECIES: NAD(P)/FAD-dependent oxidoreductase [Burkholderia cepacia complex]MBR8261776.1 NAD(P)/FAD-dependent oxidoreductase [Burkholderia cenocepacia]MCA8212627.1 NAD(P)/FAD-dependent oxidoreductase [Burkholderia cepacia]MCW3687655.1 NAD(P)/FAD-dependent oxidoreductase [Burkholderia cenocepacia]MDN7538341.1 NAD(P)/FAD-dependent oxidoreductase [Burkholderia cenocepacia]PRF79608.1 NAD(P)/FAD-dependent oxidoreductase [Burkholderia cenocepacia]